MVCGGNALEYYTAGNLLDAYLLIEDECCTGQETIIQAQLVSAESALYFTQRRLIFYKSLTLKLNLVCVEIHFINC